MNVFLVLFLFNVQVPQLLLPEDVGALWRMHLAQGRHDRGRVVGDQVPPPRVRSEDVAQSSLDLTEFTHFLVKVEMLFRETKSLYQSLHSLILALAFTNDHATSRA